MRVLPCECQAICAAVVGQPHRLPLSSHRRSAPPTIFFSRLRSREIAACLAQQCHPCVAQVVHPVAVATPRHHRHRIRSVKILLLRQFHPRVATSALALVRYSSRFARTPLGVSFSIRLNNNRHPRKSPRRSGLPATKEVV